MAPGPILSSKKTQLIVIAVGLTILSGIGQCTNFLYVFAPTHLIPVQPDWCYSAGAPVVLFVTDVVIPIALVIMAYLYKPVGERNSQAKESKS